MSLKGSCAWIYAVTSIDIITIYASKRVKHSLLDKPDFFFLLLCEAKKKSTPQGQGDKKSQQELLEFIFQKATF